MLSGLLAGPVVLIISLKENFVYNGRGATTLARFTELNGRLCHAEQREHRNRPTNTWVPGLWTVGSVKEYPQGTDQAEKYTPYTVKGERPNREIHRLLPRHRK